MKIFELKIDNLNIVSTQKPPQGPKRRSLMAQNEKFISDLKQFNKTGKSKKTSLNTSKTFDNCETEKDISQLNLTEFEEELFSEEDALSEANSITFSNQKVKENPKIPPLFVLPKINKKSSRRRTVGLKLEAPQRRDPFHTPQIKSSKLNDLKSSIFMPTYKTYMINKAVNDKEYSMTIDPSKSYEFAKMKPKGGQYLRRTNHRDSKQAIIQFVSNQKRKMKHKVAPRAQESDTSVKLADQHYTAEESNTGRLRRSATANSSIKILYS
ncbi:unnamed protein product [Moneuplotes crassus]|uniref:Uncharacterized protein n=1 Tax=Euplotes crassus TaxID=5936 RepID=A0AAD1XWT7_EUPCR|nr:unnamed protein product [Moneuplotes crassus]